MEKTMTVKDIAKFCGKDETTVQRWIKKRNCKTPLYNGKMQLRKGHETDFTLDEVEEILSNSGMGKDAVLIFMQSARQQSNVVPTTENHLTKQDIELISTIVSMTVAKTMDALNSRVEHIEQRIDERKALLPPPQIKPRDHINMLVRDYSQKTKKPFSQAWGELYKQFSYRTNSNPKQSAKNRGMSILDYIDVEGQIETLESIAIDLCR